MILDVSSIVFRDMTYADFRHINKVGGEEAGGGGQSYIDFPTMSISREQWETFLGEPTGQRANGPEWIFQINSLGLQDEIELTIYQRRRQSISVSSQKIHSRSSNRVPSWHPENGFPDNYNPENENLIIYIVKTTNNEFWAGWILYSDEYQLPFEIEGLEPLFNENAGYLNFEDKNLKIDTGKANWGFKFRSTSHNTEEEVTKIKNQFEEDKSNILYGTDEDEQLNNEVQERVVKYRSRNTKLVRKLKELYRGQCQITGDTYTFKKPNGEVYSEVHHLIPLGEEGSDSYSNMIVVSPLIHRMLHYAEVSEIKLADIANNELEIQINDTTYKITWHPNHARLIEKVLEED